MGATVVGHVDADLADSSGGAHVHGEAIGTLATSAAGSLAAEATIVSVRAGESPSVTVAVAVGLAASVSGFPLFST